MVDLWADVLVVDLAYPLHRLLREGGHLGGGEVVLELLGALRAGDGARDGLVHENPAQRQLRQGVPFGNQLFELLGCPEAGFEVHAREGFAAVEGLAFAVEIAVVVRRELAVGAHLAGEEAAGERDAGENADVPLLGEREELLGWLLAEDVEDDLDGLHVRVVEGHPRFLDLLYAHTVVADLARLLQPVQRLEGGVLTVRLCRRAMELQQVQGIDPKVLQATLDEGRQVVVIVSFRNVRIEATSGLGRDQYFIVWSVLQETTDELLAASVAVYVRRVEKVHAEVDRAVKRGVGGVIAHSAPVAPEGPDAEAELRDAHPRLPEVSILQSFV